MSWTVVDSAVYLRGGVSELEYASEPNGDVGGACHEDHRQVRGIDSGCA